MQSRNAILEGGQELSVISQQDFNHGSLLQRIISAVNSLASNVGVSAVGKLPPPPPVDSIQVQGTQSGNVLTAPSETLHWTMAHNQEVQKGIHYFTEIDTNPNFTQPHVIAHGTSRTGFLHLPSQDNNGVQQTYYMRSYPQMPGSDPQKPTVLGGLGAATQIVMTPPTTTVTIGGLPVTISIPSKTTLLPSTGSGTAAPNGQQGGHGLGKVLTRPAPTTKRSLA